jgi:predicted nucleic acid-binding protein
MVSRGNVYVETTVFSYLAARPSRDLRVAAHQQITAEWWDSRRHQFVLFVSQLVVEEASAGDPTAAARRGAYLADLTLLELSDTALTLAEKLLADSAVPIAATEDAIHIAVAAVHGMHYLMTWNCKHIANATTRNRIEMACNDAGYDMPIICTPEELLEE